MEIAGEMDAQTPNIFVLWNAQERVRDRERERERKKKDGERKGKQKQ